MTEHAKLVTGIISDICILTTALSGHREDEPVPSTRLRRRDPMMLTLHHVATLLTTGNARDINALRVVAVTANANPNTGAIQCILAAQNMRSGESPSTAEIRPLLLDSAMTADKVLDSWGEAYSKCVLLLLS